MEGVYQDTGPKSSNVLYIASQKVSRAVDVEGHSYMAWCEVPGLPVLHRGHGGVGSREGSSFASSL
mgnify:CR=1 FL=1